MLKEKDKEIVELAARVRKLLTLHHRNTLAKKAWADERSRLEAELASLRDQLVKARSANQKGTRGTGGAYQTSQKQLGTGMSQTQTGMLSPSSPIAGITDPEAVSRELQNLRSLGTTTAAALEKLKSEGGFGYGSTGGQQGVSVKTPNTNNTYGFEKYQLKTAELAPIPAGIFTQRETRSSLDKLSHSVTFTEYGSALTGRPRRPVSTRGNRLGKNGMPTYSGSGNFNNTSRASSAIGSVSGTGTRPISASTLRR